MKTEEPTPRRLRRARELGDSPVSQALGQSLGLVAAVLLAPAAVVATAARAAALLRAAMSPNATPLAPSSLALEVVTLSVPLLAAVAGTTAAVGLWQTQAVVSGTRLVPDLGRLDPVAGARNLFRLDRLLALARSLVAASLATALGVWLLREHAADLANTTGNPDAIGTLAFVLGRSLGVAVALVGVALGMVDLVVVGRLWRRRHRMTKDEVRREYREAEGDPEVKARRRRAHQQALTGSIVNAVKDATVVIVNPTHLASALRYVEDGDEAPKLVAQGEGELARFIVEAARAYGIPCVRDVPVARALRELELGDEIPEALYEAVAEILREIATGGDDGASPPGAAPPAEAAPARD